MILWLGEAVVADKLAGPDAAGFTGSRKVSSIYRFLLSGHCLKDEARGAEIASGAGEHVTVLI